MSFCPDPGLCAADVLILHHHEYGVSIYATEGPVEPEDAGRWVDNFEPERDEYLEIVPVVDVARLEP